MAVVGVAVAEGPGRWHSGSMGSGVWWASRLSGADSSVASASVSETEEGLGDPEARSTPLGR